jgi:hypothetical protein
MSRNRIAEKEMPFSSCPDQVHGCPARFVLEGVHGIDSIQFQLVANHLDTKRIKAVQHQNIVFHALLKQIPWGVVDRLVEEYGADGDPRGLKTKPHLIAMLHAQFCGLRSLRQIETRGTRPGMTTVRQSLKNSPAL